MKHGNGVGERVERLADVVLLLFTMVAVPTRLAVALVAVDQVEASAVRRTRFGRTFVEVRFAEETGETRLARASERFVRHRTRAAVLTETSRFAQIDRSFAPLAVRIQRALAMETILVVPTGSAPLTRIGETRISIDFTMFAAERTGNALAAIIYVGFLLATSSVVQTRIPFARIEISLTDESVIHRQALTSETIQLRKTRAVVITRMTGTSVDRRQTRLAGQTRWTVTTRICRIERNARAAVVTRTRRFRLDRLA